MTTLMVCKFNLVYQQKTEAKKKLKLSGGTPILAHRKNVKTLKKITGVNRLIKEVESENSVLWPDWQK